MEQTPTSRAAEMKFFFFLVLPLFVVHLSLVVDVVEVLSDTRLGTLALDVLSGCSGAAGAGRQAAQSEQTSAAKSRKPERQHDSTGAADGGYSPCYPAPFIFALKRRALL